MVVPVQNSRKKSKSNIKYVCINALCQNSTSEMIKILFHGFCVYMYKDTKCSARKHISCFNMYLINSIYINKDYIGGSNNTIHLSLKGTSDKYTLVYQM